MNVSARTVALLTCLILSACETMPMMPTPSGFARYQVRNDGLKFLSPEGVVFRIRHFDNERNADLAFWKIALKAHLVDSGYLVLAESDLTDTPSPGYLLTTTAPAAGEDYTYVTAVFVHNNKVVAVETAGESKTFASYEKNLIDLIKRADFLKTQK